MVATARSPHYNTPYGRAIGRSGKYENFAVIAGHGSWLPDPFLESALDRESDYMQKQFQEAIYKAIGRYNKQGGKSGSSVHSGI